MIFKSILLATLFSITALAAKDYQVTGPVLELTDSKIVVQKGKEKWEILRSPATKVTGTLAVGSKVTIYYSMNATEVEAKETKAAESKANDAKPAKAKKK